MLRILYYLCKKSGKISTKKGGGLIMRHGRIIHILRYCRAVVVCRHAVHFSLRSPRRSFTTSDGRVMVDSSKSWL